MRNEKYKFVKIFIRGKIEGKEDPEKERIKYGTSGNGVTSTQFRDLFKIYVNGETTSDLETICDRPRP